MKKYMKNMEKEKFFQIIQPYFDAGLIREVYSSDIISIFNFGELFYIGCPHILTEKKEPYGVRMAPKFVETVVEDNSLLFLYIQELIRKGRFNSNAPLLTRDNFNTLKEYINANENKRCLEGHIDHELEERIIKNQKGRKI